VALATVQDVYDRVTRLFGDEAGIQLTTNDIFLWINDALEEIGNQNTNMPPETATAYVDIPAADASGYVLPQSLTGDALWTSILQVSVRRSGGSDSYYPLRYLSRLEFSELYPGADAPVAGSDYSPGDPFYYTVSELRDRIKIYPESSLTITDGLKIVYTPVASAVSDLSDVLPVPPRFRQAILDFVRYRAYEQDEDWSAADRMLTMFNTKVQRSIDHETAVNNGVYPRINSVGDEIYG
jgi:hypothetical protein